MMLGYRQYFFGKTPIIVSRHCYFFSLSCFEYAGNHQSTFNCYMKGYCLPHLNHSRRCSTTTSHHYCHQPLSLSNTTPDTLHYHFRTNHQFILLCISITVYSCLLHFGSLKEFTSANMYCFLPTALMLLLSN